MYKLFVSIQVFLAASLIGEISNLSAQDSKQLAKAAKNVKQIIGHRGSCADRPENTLASYRRAIEAGATVMEMDVRVSKDGTLISLHDADVKRTTNGKGLARDFTLAELRGWMPVRGSLRSTRMNAFPRCARFSNSAKAKSMSCSTCKKTPKNTPMPLQPKPQVRRTETHRARYPHAGTGETVSQVAAGSSTNRLDSDARFDRCLRGRQGRYDSYLDEMVQ